MKRRSTLQAIWWDNGKDYDEHERELLCVMEDEYGARALVDTLLKWAARKRKRCPVVDNDLSIPIEEWAKADENHRSYIESLRPPYGFSCLVDDIRYSRETRIEIKPIDLIPAPKLRV